MKNDSQEMETALVYARTFPFPREKVFAAWVNPEAVKQWLGKECGDLESVEMDLRVGGSYRIQWRTKEGAISQVSGVYREVKPPEKLKFTWEDKELGTGETLVTVEFHDRNRGTELVLKHEGFSDTKIKEGHEPVPGR